MRVMGMMSGTSLDGVDVALVDIEGASVDDFSWRVVGFASEPYTDEQRRRISDVISGGTAERMCGLHADLAEWFAEAAARLLSAVGAAPEDVDLIGSHGQTVWHIPPKESPGDGRGRRGSTLQLGDPATLAERCGTPVVSDFRARDMAAGGHGAPLVAWTDRLMFSHSDQARCLQNIGGVANVTWLPPRGSAEPALAFDTGPGGVLIDEAVRLMTGGEQRMDRDGRVGARGRVRQDLLGRLRAHPFFDQAPPKSTGREVFGVDLVAAAARELELDGADDPGWSDLVATVTELTAASIADAYERWIRPRPFAEVLLTGGGARNPRLAGRLAELLAPVPLRPAAEVMGFDPDAKEAVAFAVLAWAHVSGIAANLPEATGAGGPVVLGSLTPAGSRSAEGGIG